MERDVSWLPYMRCITTTQIRMNICPTCNRHAISVVLKCGHGYCKDCYTVMLSLRPTCLRCSAMIQVSHQKIEKWQDAPDIGTTDSLFDQVYCAIHIDAVATHLCLDCGCYCCNNCVTIHKGHTLVPLTSKKKSADLKWDKRCKQLMLG